METIPLDVNINPDAVHSPLNDCSLQSVFEKG